MKGWREEIEIQARRVDGRSFRDGEGRLMKRGRGSKHDDEGEIDFFARPELNLFGG